jgi:hypothetical protein
MPINTKLIMTLSAITLAAIGITLTFCPIEFEAMIGLGSPVNFQLILQLLGALYFGFAMLNWMAKGSMIGGIYAKPVSIANFTHYFIGALALIKVLIRNHNLPYYLWIAAAIYSIFALCFWLIFSRHPGAEAKA